MTDQEIRQAVTSDQYRPGVGIVLQIREAKSSSAEEPT